MVLSRTLQKWLARDANSAASTKDKTAINLPMDAPKDEAHQIMCAFTPAALFALRLIGQQASCQLACQ